MQSAVFNGAPTTFAGRDVVPSVPDHFGGIGVRAVGAGAAQEQRKFPERGVLTLLRSRSFDGGKIGFGSCVTLVSAGYQIGSDCLHRLVNRPMLFRG
jgi:hypothetical protein